MTTVTTSQPLSSQAGAVDADANPSDDPCACARSAVEAELEKILGDPEFERNRSVSAFLRFVVDETLEGRGPRLKAFTVAMAVFHRDVNFDAQNNSIVRVQAARLRQLLQVYYAGPGAGDPIRIAMPLGGYAVKFDRAVVDDPPAEEIAPVAALPDPKPAVVPPPAAAPPRRPTTPFLLLLLVAVATLCGGFFLLAPRRAPPQESARGALAAIPDAAVLVLDDYHLKAPGAAEQALNLRMRDTIERGVSEFDNIALVQKAIERGPTPTLSYSLDMDSGREDNGKLWFSFKLFHAPSGSLIWSRAFPDVEPTNAAIEQVGKLVVRAVADPFGAINTDALHRFKSEMADPHGYFCTLALLDYMKDHTPEKNIKARDCLEWQAAKNPDDAPSLSMLSAYLVRRYMDAAPGNLGLDDLRRGETLARRAYDLAPQRSRTAYAMFLAQFYGKHFNEAFIAGEKSLAINPNSSVVLAQVGAAYISRSDYESGEALLAAAKKMELDPPRFLGAFVSLPAYMRGDAAFLELCRSADPEDGAIGLLLKIASCQKKGDGPSAARAVKILRENFPGVAADIPAALDRYALTPEIQSRLLHDLASAKIIPLN